MKIKITTPDISIEIEKEHPLSMDDEARLLELATNYIQASIPKTNQQCLFKEKECTKQDIQNKTFPSALADFLAECEGKYGVAIELELKKRDESVLADYKVQLSIPIDNHFT